VVKGESRKKIYVECIRIYALTLMEGMVMTCFKNSSVIDFGKKIDKMCLIMNFVP
jgi:hypothetical protein